MTKLERRRDEGICMDGGGGGPIASLLLTHHVGSRGHNMPIISHRKEPREERRNGSRGSVETCVPRLEVVVAQVSEVPVQLMNLWFCPAIVSSVRQHMKRPSYGYGTCVFGHQEPAGRSFLQTQALHHLRQFHTVLVVIDVRCIYICPILHIAASLCSCSSGKTRTGSSLAGSIVLSILGGCTGLTVQC